MNPRFTTRTKIAEAEFGGVTYTLTAESFYMGISKDDADGLIELRIFDTPDWRDKSVDPFAWANIHIGSSVLTSPPQDIVRAAVEKLNNDLSQKLEGKDPDDGAELGPAEQFVRTVEELVLSLTLSVTDKLRVATN